jgi:hypothetical protein
MLIIRSVQTNIGINSTASLFLKGDTPASRDSVQESLKISGILLGFLGAIIAVISLVLIIVQWK